MKTIVLCGFSGSGKDTILQELKKEIDYNCLVSCTSRPKRESEVQGREYYFLSDEEIRAKIFNDEMIEYRIYNSSKGEWVYGLTKDELKEKNIVVMDLRGLEAFKELYPNTVGIFIDVDTETRKERAKNRGSFDEIEFNRRLQDDIKSFPQERIDKCDLVLQNINLSETVNKIKTFLGE